MNEMRSMKCLISTAFSINDVVVASAFDMPEAESAMNVPLQLIDRAPHHACNCKAIQTTQPIRLPLAASSRRIPSQAPTLQTLPPARHRRACGGCRPHHAAQGRHGFVLGSDQLAVALRQLPQLLQAAPGEVWARGWLRCFRQASGPQAPLERLLGRAGRRPENLDFIGVGGVKSNASISPRPSPPHSSQ